MGIHCPQTVLQKMQLVLEAKGWRVKVFLAWESDGTPLTSRNKTTVRLLAAGRICIAVPALGTDAQRGAHETAHASLHCNRSGLVQSPNNHGWKKSVDLVVNN